jgi:hypothetical protein
MTNEQSLTTTLTCSFGVVQVFCWVGARTGPDDVPLPGFELRPLGRPARSQALYRLRYPGSAHRTSSSAVKLQFVKFWVMTPCSLIKWSSVLPASSVNSETYT